MKLKKLIAKQVKSAFKIAGDLTTEATLKTSKQDGFDMSTGTPTVVSDSSVDVKVLILKTVLKNDGVATREYMVNREGIEDMKIFDTIEDGDGIWRVLPSSYDDGYLAILQAVRGS